MSHIVNRHNNPRYGQSSSSPFTKTLLLVMLLVGCCAFASVALVPFRAYPFLLELVIVIAGPLELLVVWILTHYNQAYLETARYHTYGYVVGLAFGFTCLGIF
jgi:hypothetical protein